MGLRLNRLGVAMCGVCLSAGLSAQSLDLKRVTLSSSGVGYFEYEAVVDRDATLRLPVKLDQVDDVLKSLVVYDSKGGVGGISLLGREPLAELLRQLPFDAAALSSMPELLQALRGAQLVVRTATGELRGRIVSVEPFTTQAHGKEGGSTTQNRVALMTAQGMQRFVLEEARSWQFADAALRDQVDGALASMASNRARDGRTLEIVTKGSERRTVRIGYVTSVPIWKSAYRLTVPSQGGKTGQLQGWAVVENLSGQDWKNVELTLTSGKPVAFAQNLYSSYFNQRPQVPVEMPNRIVPRADTGAIATRTEFAPAMVAAPAPASAPAPAPMAAGAMSAPRAAPAPVAAAPMARVAPVPLYQGFADASDAAQAQDQDTQMSYRLPLAVSVGSGRSLAVPIIAANLPMERVAQHQPQVSNQNPLAVIQVTNNSANTLPPGAVTIYEADARGGSFLGDAQLAVLPAGDNRLLAFALDQKISLISSVNNTSTTTRVGLERSMLVVDTVERIVHTYAVKSSQTQEQTVVVEVPKYAEHTLSAPSGKLLGETAGRLRIGLPTPANSALTHQIVQERTHPMRLALANVYGPALPEYLRYAKDDATASALRRVMVLRAQIDTQAALVTQANGDMGGLREEQKRLRENLESTEKGSALHRRFTASLNESEDKIEKSVMARDSAQASRLKSEAELKAYLASL
jgi:Domain of unknown function (DUF4139)